MIFAFVDVLTHRKFLFRGKKPGAKNKKGEEYLRKDFTYNPMHAITANAHPRDKGFYRNEIEYKSGIQTFFSSPNCNYTKHFTNVYMYTYTHVLT